MNMQRTSGLGWIRGSKDASPHAPAEVRDSARTGSAAATCGRAPVRCADRSRRAPDGPRARLASGSRRRRTPQRRYALLCIVAALLVTPALAYADLLTATITNEEENVLEEKNAVFTVTLAGGVPTQPVEVQFKVSGTAEPETTDPNVNGDYDPPTEVANVVGDVACDSVTATCTGTLTIAMDTTTGTITIPTIRDPASDLLEGPETLTVTLTRIETAAGVVRLGTPSSATATIIEHGTVTVAVDDVTSEVTEGDEATFMVTLSGEVSEDVTVGYVTADGSATSGRDYTAAEEGAALVIEAGDTSGMITVQTLDDTLEEADETVKVTLLGPDLPDNVALGRHTATATIADDEVLTANVEVPTNTAEGSRAVFTIKLTGGNSSADVSVAYTVSGLTPLVDYELPPGTTVDGTNVNGKLIIPAGAETGTLTIQTIADDDDDTVAETLTLTLDTAATKAGMVDIPSGQNSAGTVVQPSNRVTVSVADTTVVEGGRAVFTVTLSEPVANATTVAYVTAPTDSDVTNSFNASAADFDVVTDGRLTIAAGRTRGTVAVETEEDNLTEDPETFTVTLSEPPVNTNVAELELGRETATATITDDDPLTVSVASDQVTAIEAGQTATFTVSLSGGVGSESVTVRYTVSGTAKAGEDYDVPSEATALDGGYTAELTLAQDATLFRTAETGQISIPTLPNDALLEVAETLTVTLTRVTTARGTVALGTANKATATIGPSNRTVTVTVGPPEAAVAEGGVAAFPVTLLGPVAMDVVVGYMTVNGTAGTADFAAQSRGTLTIEACEAAPADIGDCVTTGTIEVRTLDDMLEEADETFSVRLSLTGQPANVALGNATAEATITDNETLTASVSGPANVAVGQTATYTVALAGGAGSEDVEVTYTVTGSATVGEDYASPGAKTIIRKGQRTATITIRTLANATLPAAMTVTLTDAKTSAGTVAVTAPTSVDTTIVSDTTVVSVGDVTVAEGGTATFTVTLTGATHDTEFSVGYTNAGTAADFTGGLSGTLMIPARARSGRFMIQTWDDQLAENAETFTVQVTLSGSPAGVVLGRNTATLTITDNDTLTATVTSPSTVVEGSTANFAVSLAGATSTAAVEVDYEVGGTAEEEDYTAPSGTLTIAEAASMGTIEIPVATDVILEGAETLTVSLTDVVPGAGTARLGTPRQATTTIANQGANTAGTTDTRDWHDTVTVTASPPTAGSVAEGDVAGFSVALSRALSRDVTVEYTTVSGTAGTADYVQTRGTVTIAACEDIDSLDNCDVDETVEVRTLDDMLAEGAETFGIQLSLSGQPANVEIGNARATVTITDNDTLTLSLDGADNVIAGQTATYTVEVSGGTGSEDIAVAYTVTGTATAGEDYTAPSGLLTIRRGQRRVPITIRTLAGATANNEITVTLTEADTRAGTVTAPTAEFGTTIKSADTTIVSVGDVTVREGGAATFAVTMTGATHDTAFDVSYSQPTNGGTANATADFTGGLTGTVAVAARARTARFTIHTFDDELAEDTETFSVELALQGASADVALGRKTATGTITDNDRLTATVTGPITVVERPAPDNVVTFTVKLVGATSTDDVEIDYEVSGTVTAGDDYSPRSGTLTIEDPQSTGAIPITLVNDGILEGDETLTLTLTEVATGAGDARLGTPKQVTITVGDGDYTVTASVAPRTAPTEGAETTFDVTLSARVAEDVTVGYATEDGTAIAGADYVAVADAMLTIAAGDMVGTFTVQTLEDELAERAETFKVMLSLLDPPDDVLPGTVLATQTITDDEEVTASVSGPENVPEGKLVTFTVTLTGGTGSEDVVVRYDVLATGDTASSADYEAPSGRLTIPERTSTGKIEFRISNDTLVEDGETLTVTLEGADSAGNVDVAGAPGNAYQTTIMPADTVIVSVSDVTVVEGSPALFAVTLSEALTEDVKVDYATANGPDGVTGAEADGISGDYIQVGSNASLVIPAGQTTGTITVETLEDSKTEEDETFSLTLALDAQQPEKVELGIATGTATITDDTLSVSVMGPETVTEGEAAEYVVTVAGGTDSEPVTVTIAVSGSATAGEDYAPPSETLTIAAGAESATFAISTTADDVLEGNESLIVTLLEATVGEESAAVGSATWVTTIEDDDAAVTISVEDAETVVEGEPVMFTVTLSGAVSTDITLGYATANDTATGGTDYTAPEAGATVVVAAGETTAEITIDTRSDTTAEGDETFTVTLTADNLPEGVSLPQSSASATGTITDYALMVAVGPTTVAVAEDSSETLTVTLTGGANRADVVIPYTVGGTATAADYTPLSGTLTIPQGSLTGEIVISALADNVLDDGETVVVTLGTPTTTVGVVRLGSPSVATATIRDSGTVTVSVDDESAEEGDAIEFTITLSGLVAEPVTVEYRTTGDTATEGVDYQGVSNGTLVIPAGQTGGTFTVRTEDDREGEPTETFTVSLSLASGTPGGVTLARSMVTGTILDNDITLQPLVDVSVAEGERATIALQLDRVTKEPVTLSYETIAGSATFRDDYLILAPDGTPLPASGMVTLPPESQAIAVTVQAVDDTLAEGPETFMVRAMLGSGGSPQQATVTIEDNDELSVRVTAPKTVTEGDVARFTVTVGGAESTAPVNVSYSLGGTAKAPADYSAPNPAMVSIPAGEETATIAIETKADQVLEVDETLVVTLTEATTTAGEAEVGSPRSATTTIQDPVYHSINRVNQTLLPGITRASAAGALEAVSARMALAAQGDPSAAMADLAGLTGLYRALLANERAVQDGSYDLAQVLGGSSFLVPLSSHDGAGGGGIGGAVWGGGDFRQIGGGASDDEDSVEWGGSVWSARLGADMRFVDSLLTGLVVSWTSGGLDYTDELAPSDREGTYATWLISAYPYVGWSSTDFGLWATGGFGFGGVSIDDADEDMEAQEADLTQWSLGAGASVTLLSTEGFIAGGTTDLKLKAEGFLAGASVAENEAKTIEQLDVGVNQARAAIEASHAQYFAGGGSLKPSLEIGGRFDGGDGETGAGIEVGGGLTYADPGSGLTVAAGGRALVIRDGNYGEWGLTGLIQLDPNAAGHGLMMSVRPAFGVTASGINGLWEHGTFDLLAGGQPGGRVEAEIGYGLPAFGMAGVLTPFAAAALTDAGAHSLSLGGRLELGPAFDLILEAVRSDSASADTEPVYDVTLEGSIRW